MTTQFNEVQAFAASDIKFQNTVFFSGTISKNGNQEEVMINSSKSGEYSLIRVVRYEDIYDQRSGQWVSAPRGSAPAIGKNVLINERIMPLNNLGMGDLITLKGFEKANRTHNADGTYTDSITLIVTQVIAHYKKGGDRQDLAPLYFQAGYPIAKAEASAPAVPPTPAKTPAMPRQQQQPATNNYPARTQQPAMRQAPARQQPAMRQAPATQQQARQQPANNYVAPKANNYRVTSPSTIMPWNEEQPEESYDDIPF